MCPNFTNFALFPACEPQNPDNPTTRIGTAQGVECMASIAFDRRRSNGRYEPAHAFGSFLKEMGMPTDAIQSV
jgi:hypothetical protein